MKAYHAAGPGGYGITVGPEGFGATFTKEQIEDKIRLLAAKGQPILTKFRSTYPDEKFARMTTDIRDYLDADAKKEADGKEKPTFDPASRQKAWDVLNETVPDLLRNGKGQESAPTS